MGVVCVSLESRGASNRDPLYSGSVCASNGEGQGDLVGLGEACKLLACGPTHETQLLYMHVAGDVAGGFAVVVDRLGLGPGDPSQGEAMVEEYMIGKCKTCRTASLTIVGGEGERFFTVYCLAKCKAGVQVK